MKYNTFRAIIVEIKEMLAVVLIVIFMMTFLISQNRIPSGSMIPTLNIEDRLFVSMIPYYYRSPIRGEIVVFDGPDGHKWIKRVVGLPNEVIDIQNGNIYINGERLDETAYLNEEGISALNPIISTQISFPYTIPEGHYFLLGDNRLESNDCRYIGPIAEEKITGKAVYRIYPFDEMGSLAS